jgi:hypothetical protein
MLGEFRNTFLVTKLIQGGSKFMLCFPWPINGNPDNNVEQCVSQPPVLGPVPGPIINYTGPRSHRG